MLRESAIAECPVSFITPDSQQYVQISMRAKQLKSFGLAIFPPGDLPAKLGDALTVIEGEANVVENRRDEIDKQVR